MAAHKGLMAPFRNPINKVRFEPSEPRSRVATARWIAKIWEAAGFFVARVLCGGSDGALIGTDDADGMLCHSAALTLPICGAAFQPNPSNTIIASTGA